MRVPFACVAAIVLTGLVVAGCSGVTDPSQNQIQTLSAVVQPGGFNSVFFTVSHPGEYSVTLISLTPPASVFVLASFASSSSGQCVSPIQQNQLAAPGHIVLSGSINPGSYCVAISDEGVFSVPETFTVQVSHP
jgi:hypothetical protein